jgi:hypothetical protein
VRRMVVALAAVVTLGLAQVFAPSGVNQATAVGIGIVTLGYFGSKFAEAVSLALKAWLEGRK